MKNEANIVKKTVIKTIIVILVIILIVSMSCPMYRIYGDSMSTAINEGDIALCVHASHAKQGDVVIIKEGSRSLVRRCIAVGGQSVKISDSGIVSVDGKRLEEKYLTELAMGESDVRYPVKVPDDSLFLMGDHRSVAIDSRKEVIGCVENEKVTAKAVLIIWPVSNFGLV